MANAFRLYPFPVMFSRFAKFASFLNFENCSAKSVIPFGVPRRLTHIIPRHDTYVMNSISHILLNETFELEIRSKFFVFIKIANYPIGYFDFTFPSRCWSCLWSVFLIDNVIVILRNDRCYVISMMWLIRNCNENPFLKAVPIHVIS